MAASSGGGSSIGAGVEVAGTPYSGAIGGGSDRSGCTTRLLVLDALALG